MSILYFIFAHRIQSGLTLYLGLRRKLKLLQAGFEKMQIGEVAAQAGVKTHTIRFYERRGLLKEPMRSTAGYRVYPAGVVRIVRFIKQSQELGYTLAEIKQLLALHEQNGNAAQVRALATAKIASINNRIESLAQMRDELANVVARCQCGSAAEPDCPAIEILDYKATNF